MFCTGESKSVKDDWTESKPEKVRKIKPNIIEVHDGTQFVSIKAKLTIERFMGTRGWGSSMIKGQWERFYESSTRQISTYLLNTSESESLNSTRRAQKSTGEARGDKSSKSFA